MIKLDEITPGDHLLIKAINCEIKIEVKEVLPSSFKAEFLEDYTGIVYNYKKGRVEHWNKAVLKSCVFLKRKQKSKDGFESLKYFRQMMGGFVPQ